MNVFRSVLLGMIAITSVLASSVTTTPPNSSRATVIQLVVQVQRADYEDDRATLKRLHEELLPFINDKDFGEKVQYWRGFALWRRAINGFNDGVARPELRADLQQALDDFAAAGKRNPAFVDAKIGALGCESLIGYIIIENGAQMQDAEVQEVLASMRQLRKEAETLAPDNPRLLWVMGPNVLKSPPERGGGQAKALEMYTKGLELIRRQKVNAIDPLQPSWGEPELLMSLAYTNLYGSKRDLNAAEQYAQSALKLVPYWHYVHDILLPQIQQARKQTANAVPK